MNTLRFAIATCLLISACDSNPTTPGSGQEPFDSLTVDASSTWALVRLGDPASTVSAADPTTSAEWDIGFFATSVMLNGGAAGPGEVVGHCLCANAGATDDQILALVPAAERQRFLDVGMARVPATPDDWQSDALAPAIEGWYAYDSATHIVSAAPEKVWKIRTSDGAFAKLHVIDIADAAQAHAGRVTIEFAVQDAPGSPLGAAQTATLDASGGGRVYFDLLRAEVTDASDWDIAIEGYDIRINGGVSGGGGAGAVLADESFDEMTDASDAPAEVYAGDAFGGVFDEHPWYRYNLEGNHQIHPTFDVYLVRRGDDVYKVQLVSYYGPTGDTRQITFRYALLTE